MTYKDRGPLIAFVVFLLNTCVVAPIIYIFSDHIRDYRNFKDKVASRFIETDRKENEIKRFALEASVSVEGQARELDEIKNRINRIESRVYELSSRSVFRSDDHGQK